MGETPLPTAREAMQQAVQRAQTGEIEAGMLWVAIARELREGSRPAPAGNRIDEAFEAARKLRDGAVPVAPQLDADPVIAAAQRAEAAAGVALDETQAAAWTRGDQAAIARAGAVQGEALDRTQAIRWRNWQPGDRSVCKHCNTPVELAEEPRADEPGETLREWRHKYTQAPVCAVPWSAPAADGLIKHTWATPKTAACPV